MITSRSVPRPLKGCTLKLTAPREVQSESKPSKCYDLPRPFKSFLPSVAICCCTLLGKSSAYKWITSTGDVSQIRNPSALASLLVLGICRMQFVSKHLPMGMLDALRLSPRCGQYEGNVDFLDNFDSEVHTERGTLSQCPGRL